MPRMMSFALTTQQFKDETKDVTRRQGWRFLKPGDIVIGVKKAMGLKKGEKVQKLGPIQILSTRWEPLHFVDQNECIREGFPDLTPVQFIDMYCTHNQCEPDSCCNRIEFEYICSCNFDEKENWALDGLLCFCCGLTIRGF